jgi:hypothetical protein
MHLRKDEMKCKLVKAAKIEFSYIFSYIRKLAIIMNQ